MAKQRKNNIEFEVGLDGNITKYSEPKVSKKNNIEFEVDLDGNIHKYNYSKKAQLPKATQKKSEQDSFSTAINKLGDVLDNSFVKSQGLSFSTAVTDLANLYDAGSNVARSIPVAGKLFKAREVARDTLVNAATNLGVGAMKSVEGTADFISDLLVNPAEQGINYAIDYVKSGKKVADENLKDLKKMQQRDIKRDLTKEFQDKVGYSDVVDDLEKNSLIRRDNLGGQVTQAVGGMVPSLVMGQAFARPEPVLRSTKGLSGLDKAKVIAGNIGKSFASQTPSNIMLGTSSYGSGLEEALNNGATLDQARLYGIGSSAKEMATEWITGGIPGLGGKGGLDLPVEKLINKTTGKIKNEYAKAFAKTLANYGYKFIGEGLEEGISEIIDPYLKNATYSKGEKVNWPDVFSSFIVGGITGGLLEAPNTVADFKNNIVEAKNNVQQQNAILPVANNNIVNKNDYQQQNAIEGNPLIESKNQVGLPLDNNTVQKLNTINQNQERFVYESSDNSKIDNFRRSANQFMNNSNETKSFVQTVEKVINDKGYNITLDSTLGDSVNGRISTNKNGEIDIKLNPNSDRAAEFILTHEITHAIETKEMKDLVMDYASKNSEFNNALESLKKLYNTEDVSSEVLADVSGQLFGNTEFINKLSTSKPGIFKRLYNKIVEIANKITGNSKESLFIKNLKNKWEEAYNRNKDNNFTEEYYSLFNKQKKKNNEVLQLSDELINDIQNKTNENNKNKENVSMVPIEELLPLIKNGGYRTSDEIQKLTNSIIADGIENPIEIAVDENGNLDLYNGNHRLLVAKNLGLKEIPIKYKTTSYLENDVNLDYNRDINNFYKGEDDGNFSGVKESKKSINSSEPNIRYGLTDSKQFKDQRGVSRDGRLFEPLLQHNDGASSDSTFEKNDISKGSRRELENGYFSENEKYSKNIGTWQKFVEANFKSNGTKTNLKDTRLDTNNTEQKIINKEIEKITKKYDREKNKNKKIITKEASKILEFDDYQQKRKFTDLVSEYYDNPDLNKIRQDIKANFSEKRVEYINDYVRNIKNVIRGTDLQITDYVRKNLTDFGDFKKENFNRLKLKNQGRSIDSFYNELAENYPSVFNKDITNEVDQLGRLSEFMNEDDKFYEKYNLDDSAINEAAQYVYDSIKNKDNIDDLINSISISPKQIRKEKTAEYREYAENFVNNSEDWVDKKLGLSYKTNTMKRNFYDVMGKKDGDRLYRSYIEPIFNHNAQMQNDISSYNEKIAKLKLNDKESTAVQMFGEYKYNPETLVTGMEVDEFITKNKLDYKKIENAVETFRATYDELIERVNETLKSQGYKEIEYRKGYFPHFVDDGAKSKLGRIFEKMGWKIKDNSIPTDIAGITDTFKPGKVWNRNAQQRKGKYTNFNALKGFDNYVRGAMETIYFTEDIQKLRALENEIRYQCSEKGVQTQIDEILSDTSIDFEERQEKIDKIFTKYNTPLNNLVSEIRDYTNSIANKKSILDRTMEQATNRKVYSVMQNVSSRLSANMVGLNLSSAITNFIPITQATSQVKSKYLLKGLRESIKNQSVADNFESKSVFLTSRLNEADRLYKTKLEKASDKANILFDGIDSITANTIVRGKYYENIANGMSEYNAIRNADEFARDLMAGRTKGEMPTIFNSKNPLVKLFTSFQLEVNNQYQYMFKDLPRDLADEGKKKLISAFAKMFFGAWIYNQLTEKVVGRKSAFSPADTIKEIYDTTTDKNLKITEKSEKILENLTQDVPFVGNLIGGGRLPISSVANPLNIIKGESTAKEEAKKALYYTILPFGGGQLKKTIDGASMYINNKKIKGSYSSKGQLRFEAKKDPASVAQSLLFGQYASENAREYFDNSYSPLDDNQLKEVEKMNISVSKYRKYQDDKKEINKIKSDKDQNGKSISGSAAGKKAYLIMNSNFSKKEKNYLLSKVGNSKVSVKVEDLEQLPNEKKVYKFYFGLDNDSKKNFINEIKRYNVDSEDLYNYYSKRQELRQKYTSGFAKKELINYIKNSKFNEKTKWYLYNKDYGNDTFELLVNTFNIKTDDYFNTMEYADKIAGDYPNTKQANIRKRRVFEYINNLKCSQKQKIVLFSKAGYSTSKFKDSMYTYIKDLNLTQAEKEKIWKSLY